MRMRETIPSISLVLVGFLVGPAAAMFMEPNDVPVDRVLENISPQVQQHPRDPRGHYLLGRVHYLAWSLKTGYTPTWDPGPEPEPGLPKILGDALVGTAEWQLQRIRRAEATRLALAELGLDSVRDVHGDALELFWNQVRAKEKDLAAAGWEPPGRPSQEQLDAHARHAILHFRKAIELDPQNALYHLGLADIRRQYAARAGQTGLGPDADQLFDPGDPDLVGMWNRAALEDYASAFTLSRAGDVELKNVPVEGLGALVSLGAIEGYAKVAQALGKGAQDARLVKSMREHKARLQALPPGPVTPIIFSFQPGRSLDQLLAPDTLVRFDLDGDGREELRPWVGPDAVILVWDPNRTGRITSGRQLFGTVTWWLFWPTGYEALGALDNDGDGRLSGPELGGLALWSDRDQDARCDPGEVVPIERTGVAALACRPLRHDGPGPMHPRGVELEDGTFLPTWDWVAPAVRTVKP